MARQTTWTDGVWVNDEDSINGGWKPCKGLVADHRNLSVEKMVFCFAQRATTLSRPWVNAAYPESRADSSKHSIVCV